MVRLLLCFSVFRSVYSLCQLPEFRTWVADVFFAIVEDQNQVPLQVSDGWIIRETFLFNCSKVHGVHNHFSIVTDDFRKCFFGWDGKRSIIIKGFLGERARKTGLVHVSDKFLAAHVQRTRRFRTFFATFAMSLDSISGQCPISFIIAAHSLSYLPLPLFLFLHGGAPSAIVIKQNND